MKKVFGIIVVTILCIGMLVGCGGGEEVYYGDEAQTPAETQEYDIELFEEEVQEQEEEEIGEDEEPTFETEPEDIVMEEPEQQETVQVVPIPIPQSSEESVEEQEPVEEIEPAKEEEPAEEPEKVVEIPVRQDSVSASYNNKKNDSTSVIVPDEEEFVGNLCWVPVNGGTKYHTHSGCSNMKDPMQVSIETALDNGYTACKRCH